MLGKFEARRRRGWQRMRWMDGILDSMDVSLSRHHQIVKDREDWCAAIRGVAKSQTRLSDWTTTTPFHWIFSLCLSSGKFPLYFPPLKTLSFKQSNPRSSWKAPLAICQSFFQRQNSGTEVNAYHLYFAATCLPGLAATCLWAPPLHETVVSRPTQDFCAARPTGHFIMMKTFIAFSYYISKTWSL